MPDTAIRVEHLAKRYRLGADAPHRRVTDAVRRLVGRPPRRPDSHAHAPELWALDDVSFEVQRGEVLGIIGRNGAGKSTLLKILSRITEPTRGRAVLHGRVGSLLEVGTGFHQELTGRENIYLNGAILGMKRHEINAKLDDIIAFSGIETFLDTPIKRYSTGMKTRLGFAVAAHLEPEILIVDEVLAVGDVEFQRRCLGKMEDVATSGRTVLFVSHNMASIQSLCTTCIWISDGKLRGFGSAPELIDDYIRSLSTNASLPLGLRTDRRGNGAIRFSAISIQRITDTGARFTDSTVPPNSAIDLTIPYEASDGQPVRRLVVSVTITDPRGMPIFTCGSRFSGTLPNPCPASGVLRCQVPRLPLAPGKYSVHLSSAVDGQHADVLDAALNFTVTSGDCYGSGALPTPNKHGSILVDHQWTLESARDVPSTPSGPQA